MGKYIISRNAVSLAALNAKIATGTIILQKQVSRFSNNTKAPICQLCSKEIEDILHFIVRCSALQKVRSPFLTAIQSSGWVVHTLQDVQLLLLSFV
jgi:hypothetical protein